MVVDDDVAVRSAIQTVLSHEGYDVVVADGGPSGVKALRTGRFDAVLVDIFMPGMDGLEAIKSFHDSAPSTPLIAMSGYLPDDPAAASPDFLKMATKLGATFSLRKPFRPRELLDAVTACLSRGPHSDGDPPQRSAA